MKKTISINLQGIIFHIEDDGYEVLSRYLTEVKAHFASYQGHDEIVADIEGRIAELFAARLSAAKQVITLADVEELTAKMGHVSDFASADEDDEPPAASNPAAGPQPTPATDPQELRRLYRDLAHRKIAGVCAGLAQYFMVNPLVVRLVFLAVLLLPGLLGGPANVFSGDGLGHWHGPNLGGIALIAYVILWIVLPKRSDAPAPIDTLDLGGTLRGRRLFRDTEHGQVGGVAAGLAAYFRTDVVLIRVLLLLGLFAGGSTFIAYTVLWIVVPEARTVSERLQMRGDAVTLSGIDNDLRSNAFDPDAPAPAGRPVGTFVENTVRNARPALGFVGTLIRWAVGAFLIFWGASFLISVLALLATALHIIPSSSVAYTDNGFMFNDDNFGAAVRNVPAWGAVAGAGALGIPGLALLLLGLRLLLQRPVLGRTAGLSLLGLWLLSVVGSVAAGFAVAGNFRTHATYTTTQPLTVVPGRRIVLDSRNLEGQWESVRFSFVAADSTAAPLVEEEFTARGPSQDEARATAQNSVRYAVSQRDSVLTFDQGTQLLENAPFRNQKLHLTLHLPLGKVYRLTPLFQEHLRSDDYEGNNAPHDNREHRATLTADGKFRCLDCPPATSRDDHDEDHDNRDNDEVVNLGVNGTNMQVRVNTDGDNAKFSVTTEVADFSTDPASYGSTRRSLNDPGEFNEVEVNGGLRVLLRQGDSYSVQAAGPAEAVRELRMSVNGDRLVLRNGDHTLFGLAGKPVLVTVTLPTLRVLELSGACQAQASGFNQDDDLRLEADGASTARLDVRVASLDAELDGASSIALRGHADELRLNCSGACHASAQPLDTPRATVDLSGISEASVTAHETLKADLDGSSHLTYAGSPNNIEKDISGNSTLEQVK